MIMIITIPKNSYLLNAICSCSMAYRLSIRQRAVQRKLSNFFSTGSRNTASNESASWVINQTTEQGKKVQYRTAVCSDSKVDKWLLVKDSTENDSLSKIQNQSMPDKLKELVQPLIKHFLPRGYPQSVTPGYLHFAGSNAISAVLSSAGGVLSMQTLLFSLGLSSGGAGVASTLPLAATLNWILKDGLGQAGTILFASFINNRFDRQPKHWRFLSSVSLEVSNILEICTAFFPQYFLPIAAVANMGKNISFLASSASRAAIHRSFALEENLADITAKTGSQNILSSLAGTSLGIAVSTYCGNDLMQTCVCFSLLSSSSLVFTYTALKYATITALTQDRFDYILQEYFSNHYVPSPESVKQKELFFILPPMRNISTLSVNIPLTQFHNQLQSTEYKSFQRDLEFWSSINPYFVIVPLKSTEKHVSNVILYLDHDASLKDVLESFVWAFYIRQHMDAKDMMSSSEIINNSSNTTVLSQRVAELVDNLLHTPESARGKVSRWITSAALLETTENRISICRN